MMVSNTEKERKLFGFAYFGLFAAIFYYVPILFIWFDVIHFEFRFHVLIVQTIILAIYSVFQRHSLRDLGFRADNLKNALLLNGIVVLSVSLALIILYSLGAIRKPTVPEWKWFYFFYVLISAPSQEFLFRSVLFAEMRKINILSSPVLISFSAITYCFMHVIYNDLITLAATLVMGIVWGAIYYKYQNFWGVAFSHAILGAISISIGLI